MADCIRHYSGIGVNRMNKLTSWIIAFLGFPIGGLIAITLIGRMDTSIDGLLGGIIAGVIIGGAQWIALKQFFSIDGRWVVATSAGLGLGIGLSALLWGTDTTLQAILTRAPLTGFLLGVAQWFILRQNVAHAYVWIPTLTLIYPAAWYITSRVIGDSINEAFFVFGASGALFFQITTGLVLRHLTHNSEI